MLCACTRPAGVPHVVEAAIAEDLGAGLEPTATVPCIFCRVSGEAAHGKAVRYCDGDRYVAFVCQVIKRHTTLGFVVYPAVGTRQR